MQSILLTGSSGFLGKVLNASLYQNGANVLTMGRSGQSLNFDISKPFEFDSDIKIQTVVHAAGKAHSVPKTAAEEQLFYDVNFEGTKNLCAAIDKLAHKPSSFIFISTVAVYGIDFGSGIEENYPLAGQTPYAKSKILAEQYLHRWAKANDIILCILRLPLIAGPNPPGNLGAMINGIRSGRYLSIGKADARKSMVWAADIAEIIPKLAEVGGIYHLTDGHHPTFGELELVISGALHKKIPLKIPLFLAKVVGLVGDSLGNRAPINSDKIKKITSTLTFDDEKARNTLDWKPASILQKLGENL